MEVNRRKPAGTEATINRVDTAAQPTLAAMVSNKDMVSNRPAGTEDTTPAATEEAATTPMVAVTGEIRVDTAAAVTEVEEEEREAEEGVEAAVLVVASPAPSRKCL